MSLARAADVVPPTTNFWRPGWMIFEDVGVPKRNPTTFKNGVLNCPRAALIFATTGSVIFIFGATGIMKI
jgi:hypothetical protein